MAPVRGASVQRYGYWDGLWARSESGRLTLVAHAVDYDGNLRGVYASPPSLTAELAGSTQTRAVAFGRLPESRSPARRLGFAWDADQQAVTNREAINGHVSVRARIVKLPYWSIVLPPLSLALLCLRRRS